MRRSSLLAAMMMTMDVGSARAQEDDDLGVTICTSDQRAAFKAAQKQAMFRAAKAALRLQAAAEEASESRETAKGAKTKELVHLLLGKTALDPLEVGALLWKELRDVKLRCLSASSSRCDGGALAADAFVLSGQPKKIFVCPVFFNKRTPEKQTRRLVHEAAHLAGVWAPKSEGETYCGQFECAGKCGNADKNADAWSQLVHCLSGETPDDAAFTVEGS